VTPPGPPTNERPGAIAAAPGIPRDGAWRSVYRAVALLFVVFPIANVLTTNAGSVEVGLVLVGSAIFGAILVVNTRIPPLANLPDPTSPTVQTNPRARLLLVATSLGVVALIAIAVTITLIRPDDGWFAFFYYASTAASTIRSSRVAVGLMVASGVATSLAFVAGGGDVAGAIVQGLSVSVIGFTIYTAIAVRRTNRALLAARTELARLAVSDERARIARDLHDTLGHSLSVIALKSELASRLVVDDPPRARAEMDDVQRVARDSLAAVRETISGYRQASLAIELAGARSALAAAGIDGRVEPAPEDLPPAADAILAWAVREGVTNILRHGRAATAVIRVEREPSRASVEIRNDRFDPPVAAGRAPQTALGEDLAATASGTGLAGLRDRVGAVGGGMEAGGLPDGGYRLHVSVPIS
jgi:two-component system, NarL family, sensor histidine kinase DesK